MPMRSSQRLPSRLARTQRRHELHHWEDDEQTSIVQLGTQLHLGQRNNRRLNIHPSILSTSRTASDPKARRHRACQALNLPSPTHPSPHNVTTQQELLSRSSATRYNLKIHDTIPDAHAWNHLRPCTDQRCMHARPTLTTQSSQKIRHAPGTQNTKLEDKHHVAGALFMHTYNNDLESRRSCDARYSAPVFS